MELCVYGIGLHSIGVRAEILPPNLRAAPLSSIFISRSRKPALQITIGCGVGVLGAGWYWLGDMCGLLASHTGCSGVGAGLWCRKGGWRASHIGRSWATTELWCIVAYIELRWQGIIYILLLHSSIERWVQLPMLREETDCGMAVMETPTSSNRPPLMCNSRSFVGQVTSSVGLLCVAQAIVGRRREA